MENSFIRDNPRRIIPNKANSYHDNGYSYTNAILTFGIYGGTSLHTNCRELARFAHEFIEPTLISRETMDTIMLNPPMIGEKKSHYGTGVMIGELEGHKYIHHGGVNAGFRTVCQNYVDDDLIVTLFGNTYNIPIETAARDIARIVLEIPARVPKSLKDYREDEPCFQGVGGLYYCDRNRDNFQLEVKDGVPYLDGVHLEQLDGSIFKQGRLNMTVSFGKEKIAICENGNIMEMRKIEGYVDQAYMEKCVGRYYCEACEGIWDVVIKNGKLVMENLRLPDKTLHWLKDDEFFSGLTKIVFTRDADGRVNGLRYSTSNARNVKFVRV
jgi:hypothetical protein